MTRSTVCGSGPAAGNADTGVRLALIGDRRCAGGITLDRHAIEPPLHDAVRLRKESVSADVDRLPLYLTVRRQTADGVAHLQDDGTHIRSIQQFGGGRQAGRTAPMMIAVRALTN